MTKEAARTSDKDFIKMYRQFIFDLSNLGRDNPGALTVFLFLCRNMDGTNAISISMQAISDFTKITRQTVSKHLQYLIREGWIQCFKSGRTAFYVVNDAVAWTSYGNQKEYCRFNSTILLERKLYDNTEFDPWDAQKHASVTHPRQVVMDALKTYDPDQLPGQTSIDPETGEIIES